jgi:hypothetical protein
MDSLIYNLLFENSMHGTSECLGNIQQLCFKHEYPDPHDWFAFALCLNKQYHQIGLDNNLAQYCGKPIQNNHAEVSVPALFTFFLSKTSKTILFPCGKMYQQFSGRRFAY